LSGTGTGLNSAMVRAAAIRRHPLSGIASPAGRCDRDRVACRLTPKRKKDATEALIGAAGMIFHDPTCIVRQLLDGLIKNDQ